MIEDNTKINNYILINTELKPSYSRIGSAKLSEYEVSVKNRAFRMNQANKKYILEKDWK